MESPGVCVGSSQVVGRLLSSCRRNDQGIWPTRLWRTAACSGCSVDKKDMSRLHFLRKLRSLKVCRKMLEIFYQSAVASVLFFGVCWGSIIRMVADLTPGWTERLCHWLKMNLDAFTMVAIRMRRNRLFIIMVNNHQDQLGRERSTFSNRRVRLRCHEDRCRISFLPKPIILYNSSRVATRELPSWCLYGEGGGCIRHIHNGSSIRIHTADICIIV